MIDFDISPDGKQVVYTTAARDGTMQLWIAPVDGSLAAVKVNVSGVRSPHFGAGGQILVQQTEGNKNYLEQIDSDGSHRAKIFPYPIGEIESVSPGRRWVTAEVPRAPDTGLPAISGNSPGPRSPAAHLRTLLLSEVVHGREVPVCVYGGFVANQSGAKPGNSRRSGETLHLAVGGIPRLAEPSVVQGAESVERGALVPGKDPAHYAWVNLTVHRNLYRISLP